MSDEQAQELMLLPDRAQAWADATFPGHDLEDIVVKIREEDAELQEAVAFGGDEDAMNEAADGIILRMRLISKLGGHPWEVVLAKFAEVEARPKEYWEGKK
jgi:phosphoribosyl-ATP pyrophosphohydrolase